MDVEEDSSEPSMPPWWTKSNMEAIRGDLILTEEELELADAIRKARAKSNANNRSIRHRARRRDEDLNGYRTQVTEQKMASSHKNRDKVLKIAAKVRNTSMVVGSTASRKAQPMLDGSSLPAKSDRRNAIMSQSSMLFHPLSSSNVGKPQL